MPGSRSAHRGSTSIPTTHTSMSRQHDMIRIHPGALSAAYRIAQGFARHRRALRAWLEDHPMSWHTPAAGRPGDIGARQLHGTKRNRGRARGAAPPMDYPHWRCGPRRKPSTDAVASPLRGQCVGQLELVAQSIANWTATHGWGTCGHLLGQAFPPAFLSFPHVAQDARSRIRSTGPRLCRAQNIDLPSIFYRYKNWVMRDASIRRHGPVRIGQSIPSARGGPAGSRESFGIMRRSPMRGGEAAVSSRPPYPAAMLTFDMEREAGDRPTTAAWNMSRDHT